MRILNLELFKYKRMLNFNIQLFNINTTDPIQLILGTNASGKSSLLAQLSPLPADQSDFAKEGHKVIKIHNRGSTYILKSWFNPSPKHSFIKDGEEMNPGHTVSVQKELVYQEFGITPEIHALQLGFEVFHLMSPSRRRYWLTMLSHVSYDYALKLFDQLSTNSRDAEGALKEAKRNLVSETSKLISIEDRERIQKEVEQAHKELNVLMEVRAPAQNPQEHYQNAQHAALEDIKRIAMQLLRIRFVAPYGVDPTVPPERDEWGELKEVHFTSVEQITEHIDLLKTHAVRYETLITEEVAKHKKLDANLNILAKTGQDGIESLHLRRKSVSQKQLEELGKNNSGLIFNDPDLAIRSLDSTLEFLQGIFLELPENRDRRLSYANLQVLKQELLNLQDEMTQTVKDCQTLAAKEAHMEEHRKRPATECPKCQHHFVSGFSELELERTRAAISTLETRLVNMRKHEEKLQTDITANNEYGASIQEFNGVIRNWPVLAPLWDHIAEEELLTRAPASVCHLLTQVAEDLKHQSEAAMYGRELVEIEQLIQSAEQLGDANLQTVRLAVEECELVVEKHTIALTSVRTRINKCESYRKQLIDAFALRDKLNVMVANVTNLNFEQIEMLRRETINHCIRQLQTTLAKNEQILSSIAIQEGLIKELNKQVEKLTTRVEALKLLVLKLSPTKGLIADGMLGFIRLFTKQMNALIKRIWTYPLRVMDCGISTEAGAELDYKFPVKVKDNEAPDVKFGSSAMKEVVDLAFRLTALKYLDLSEAPLYLDEFGASFDKEHRSRSMETIKTLIEQYAYTQLFMISHYDDSHGVLTQAQICVLDPTNIIVPKEYNTHVLIN